MNKFKTIISSNNFEKKLLKLLDESKDILDGKIEHNNINYFNDSYDELLKFILNGLNNSFHKEKNYQIVVNNFDKILPFITLNNINFIDTKIDLLIKHPNFKKKFIEGLKNYPYKENVNELFSDIYSCIDLNTFVDFFDKDVIEAVSSFNCYFDIHEKVFNELDEKKQKDFLLLLINSKFNINYEMLKYKGNNKNIIYDNIDLVMNNAIHIYFFRDFVKDNPEILKKVNDYIDNNEDKAFNNIFTSAMNINKISSSSMKDFIKLLVLDIMKNENAKLSDITYNQGGFSRVLLIGGKVLKIGNRYSKTFPNNPYIITPLMREEVKMDDESYFMEVTERVDTSKMASYEEMYQLFKNIRDLGLVWTDIKTINVGRLIKDNVIHWNEDIKPSNETLGLDNNRGSSILKKGDLVILDSDFIFDENDPNINYTNQKRIYDEFEERYQQEKQELINNKL